jgi:hypothetical protein
VDAQIGCFSALDSLSVVAESAIADRRAMPCCDAIAVVDAIVHHDVRDSCDLGIAASKAKVSPCKSQP